MLTLSLLEYHAMTPLQSKLPQDLVYGNRVRKILGLDRNRLFR